MANLTTSLDAAFHDCNVATPQTLNGWAKSIPGGPAPVDGARASKVFRLEQLQIMGMGFPLGLIPSCAPPSSPSAKKELGSFSLQSLWMKRPKENWWIGLIGQIRPKKLIPRPSIKFELPEDFIEEFELPTWEEVAEVAMHYIDVAKRVKFEEVKKRIEDASKPFLNKSLYSIGLLSELVLNPTTSLSLNIEHDGQRKDRRARAMLLHKLPEHDITLEAAWPELFVDHKGKYWDVPESISLDCSSLISKEGLRYRFGIHKNGGHPRPIDSVDGKAPASLRPGVCAKAAISYEQSKDLWRDPETKDDLIEETGDDYFRYVERTAYDIRMKEPYAAISGIIGGACEAWICGRDKKSVDGYAKRSLFGADLFGSVRYTVQQGKFRARRGDLTKFDARLDVSSASALAKGFVNIFWMNIFRKASANDAASLLASPRLNLTLQHQVSGPLVFQVDSKVCLGSSGMRRAPHIEDVVFSLNYYLRILRSGKLVAWYSPKRNEGMLEVRLFEFQ